MIVMTKNYHCINDVLFYYLKANSVGIFSLISTVILAIMDKKRILITNDKSKYLNLLSLVFLPKATLIQNLS